VYIVTVISVGGSTLQDTHTNIVLYEHVLLGTVVRHKYELWMLISVDAVVLQLMYFLMINLLAVPGSIS
jgi:hypothetical protein